MIILEKTKDLVFILDLYKEIFLDDFPIGKFHKNVENKEIFNIKENNERIGFLILKKSNENHCHMWLFGIKNSKQNSGVGHQVIKLVEEIVKKEGYKKLTLSSYNHRGKMLALAIKNGFRIVGTEEGAYGDGIKILFEKELVNKKEIRISIHNKCNFKCFFCHNEGLENSKTLKMSKEILENTLKQAIENGFTDITFTGGEPTLNQEALIFGIDYCNNLPEKPDLTIVTNSTGMTDEIIDKVKEYQGKIKINASLHTLSEEKFMDIIQTSKNYFSNTLDRLKAMSNAGIEVKANCVVLKGINSDVEDFKELFIKLPQYGVKTVKFLELLVIKSNEQHFKYFFNQESITENIKKAVKELGIEIQQLSEGKRGTKFKLINEGTELKVEAIKCTCKVGCSSCLEVRDRTIGADGEYYPCFIQSDNPCGNAQKDLKDSFSHGDLVIKRYAEIYNDSSPILIKEAKYIKKRKAVYCLINSDINSIKEKLDGERINMIRQEIFEEEHIYEPICQSPEWSEYKRQIRVIRKSQNTDKYEIYMSKFDYYIENDLFINEQQFLSEFDRPIHFDGLNKVDEFLSMLNFNKTKTYRNSTLYFYKYKNSMFSVSPISNNLCSVYLDYDSYEELKYFLSNLNIVVINEPFLKWRGEYLISEI